ncbi:MAG: DUF5009 domain-containing protein [Pirellulaceae bacterium]|nr:DUF5009 domain-containing protein [Pirellulaceae bacterium]
MPTQAEAHSTTQALSTNATNESLPRLQTASRVLSIDALRGFDMFWIVGGDALVLSALALIQRPWSKSLAAQWEHVEWEGFRFYDLIFPLFLFLVGCVLPFSLEKYRAEPRLVYMRIVRRVALLFFLGLVNNGLLQFQWGSLRVAGVLQRIAICYGIAAILCLHFRPRGLAMWTAGILLAYWAILGLIPAPGGVAGDYSIEGNLAGYLDRTYLPGRIMKQYYGFGDNEGLLSTIPAVATALLGVLAGWWLKSPAAPWTKVAGLALAGTASLTVGLAWGNAFPIIKNLWTSSFVLVAGGWSLILLAWFYAVIDVIGWRKWAFFWVVIGMNAITIYVAQRFIDFDAAAQFFLSGVMRMSDTYVRTGTGKVWFAAGTLAAEWLFLWFLYRQRIFLRV